MTLNLMLASAGAVYLSADFRLTFIDRPGFTDDLNTQKLLPVVRRDWSALVAYSGLAACPPVLDDMGRWILMRTNEIPPTGNFRELTKQLLKTNDLLERIPGVPPALTVVAVGFEGRRRFALLLSNGITNGGSRASCRTLKVHQLKVEPPAVRAFGAHDVLLSDELMGLRRTVSSADPESICFTIAEVNRSAALRDKTISSECVVGQLGADGSFKISPHGIEPNSDYVPEFIRQDMRKGGVVGFERKHGPTGEVLPLQWTGSTSSTERGSREACTLAIHSFRNAVRPLVSHEADPKCTAFWKIAGDNEPESYKFTVGRSNNHDSPPIFHHMRVVDDHASCAGEALASALEKSYLLGDLVVLIAAPENPNARRVLQQSQPNESFDHAGHVVLVELRNDASRLLDFCRAAADEMARPCPVGAVRVACIDSGGVSVGVAYYASKKKLLRRRNQLKLYAC